MTVGSLSDVEHVADAALGVSNAYQISVLNDGTGFKAMASEIESLIQLCIEFNIFYEPWMLAAAFDCLMPMGVIFVVIRHVRDGITGIFPFQLERRFRGLPVKALKSWRHPYCFLCTPLVSRSHSRGTIGALLSWFESKQAPAKLVEWDFISGDDRFFSLLEAEMRRRPAWVSHALSYLRAVFKPQESTTTGLSGKHLKELRRLERRLADEGQCSYRVMEAGEPVQTWIDRFLELEGSGWKGRESTALASKDSSRAFFSECVLAAAERNRVQMLSIEINGIPIAMKCNFISGDVAFAFKIAYDERYSKYSPGVLLELFNMRNLAQQYPDIKLMDSCAMPEHFMINRLWTARRTLTNCLAASGGIPALLIRNWEKYHHVRRFLSRLSERRG